MTVPILSLCSGLTLSPLISVNGCDERGSSWRTEDTPGTQEIPRSWGASCRERGTKINHFLLSHNKWVIFLVYRERRSFTTSFEMLGLPENCYSVVQVFSGCCDSPRDWVAYGQQNCLPHILEVRESKIKALAESVSGGRCFLIYRWLSSCRVCIGEDME